MSSIGGNFPNNGNIGSANRANKRPFNDPENKHDDTEVDNKYDGEDVESDGEHKDCYDNEQKGVESNKRQRTEEATPSELFPPNDVAPVVTELSEQEVVNQASYEIMQQLNELLVAIKVKLSSPDITDLTEYATEFVAILSRNQIPEQVKPRIAKLAFKLGKFIRVEDLKVINEKLFTNCSIKLFTECVKLGITKSNLFQIMPFIPNDKKIIQQWILVASHSDYIPFLAKICEAIAKAYGFHLHTPNDQIVQLIQLENASNLDPEGACRKFLILLLPLLIKRSPEILINKDVFELLIKYAKEPAVKAYLPLWSIPGGLPHPAFNMIFTCEPVSLYRLIEQKIITVNGNGEELTAEESLRDLVNAALSMISKLPAFKIQVLSREVLDNLGLYANLYKMTSSSSMEAFKSDYLSVFADKLMEISRGLTTDDARKDFFYKFNGLINAVMAGLSILSNQGGLTELCNDFREIYNQCAETILAGGVVTVNPYYNNPVDEYYESAIFDAKNNLKLSGHLLFTAKEGGLVLMPLGYYLKYVCAAIKMDEKDQYYSYSRIKIISMVDEGWQQTDMHDFNLTKFFKEKFSLFWPYYYPALQNSIAGTFRAIFPEELAERCELLCHSDGTNYKGFVEINFETGEIGSEKLFNLLNNVITYNEIPPQPGIYREQYKLVDGFAENVLVQYKSKFPNISEEILLVMAASVFARLSCEYMFGTNENRAVLFAEIGKLLIREAYIRYPDSQFPQWKTLTHVWSMLLSNRKPPVVNNDPNLQGLEDFCTEVISRYIYASILDFIGGQHKYMPSAWSISTVVYPSLYIPVDGGDVQYNVEQNYNNLNFAFGDNDIQPNYDAVEPAGNGIAILDNEVEPAGNGIADNEIEVSDDGSEISDDGSEISDDGSEISDDESEISDDGSEISDDGSQV